MLHLRQLTYTAAVMVLSAGLFGFNVWAADPVSDSGAIHPGITIEEAVLMALENNRALHIQRFEPDIRETFHEQEKALFDPEISFEVWTGRERYENDGLFGSGTATSSGADASVSGLLPTGTRLEAELSTQRSDRQERARPYETRLGFTATQALLQGRGVAVNMASVHQASIDTSMSRYELAGFAQSLVADVEVTYWEYVLARRQVEIVKASLKLAEQQLEETTQRVRVGGIAETELAAARAEVALRREALINAESRVENIKTRITRFIAPSRLVSGNRDITPESRPEVPPDPLEDLSDHVAVAMQMRPDLAQAKLMADRRDLEIVKTKNGLLPKMNVFIRLGKSGYADSFSGSARDMDGDAYDAYAGIEISRSVSNQAADARHRRALLHNRQQETAITNLEDLIREDVELAYIEVRRALQQVSATESTRTFQEEKLRAETAKFRVGKSTALLVAQAQRDLLESQVSEVEAITSYLNARIRFYLAEGSLLKRRGIDTDSY